MTLPRTFPFIRSFVIFLILDILGRHEASVSTWMYLGLVGSNVPQLPDIKLIPRGGFHPELAVLPPPVSDTSEPSDWCGSIPGLVDRQVALCRRNPEIFWHIRDAAKLAIKECQYQFHNERWNCTTSNDRHVFGKTMSKATKETAFITAISSAAVVYSVVSACSSGNVTGCGCVDIRRQSQKPAGDGWTWSGCTDNIEYGMWFSRQFNDAQEDIKRKDARNVKDAMHLHNKETGRTVVQRQMGKDCRCHGVSGSCETKSCWRKMAPFRDTGNELKAKHDNAVWIARKYAKKLKRRGRMVKHRPITNNELVFLEKSPDYCRHNPAKGIAGTAGRLCNATSTGPEGCGTLCCKRGYITQVIWRREQCRCKFVWCCEVKCQICNIKKEIHTCK
ncbi:Protein Wnt-4 [Hypsibius exemplaris]|uniref:Protein Wnt n=1 Tax=Hypsibius exemplaris TaxID=2072580 RepID=A0A1W0X3Y2_HYPEX|nr:Protein Wnt-4 [Hypsibius exemplaris]